MADVRVFAATRAAQWIGAANGLSVANLPPAKLHGAVPQALSPVPILPAFVGIGDWKKSLAEPRCSQTIPLPNAPQQRFLRRRGRFRPSSADVLAWALFGINSCPYHHQRNQNTV